MITFNLSERDLDVCMTYAHRMRQGYPVYAFKGNKKRDMSALFPGKVGEYVFGLWLKEQGIEIVHKPFRDDYSKHVDKDDYIVVLNGAEVQIEVKCKSCNVGPYPHYWQSVNVLKPGLLYVFTAFNPKKRIGALMGWSDLDTLTDCVHHVWKGTPNPTFEGKKHKTNEFNVRANELRDMEELLGWRHPVAAAMEVA